MKPRLHPCLALLSTLVLTSCASHGIDRHSATPVFRGSFFALSVSNLENSASWYSENLGFEIDRKGQAPNSGPKFAILSREGALLELLQIPTAKSRADWGLPADAKDVHGILKLGFEVRDIDNLYALAQARHLEIFFPIVSAKDVPLRTFGLKDPDGNIVQFFGK